MVYPSLVLKKAKQLSIQAEYQAQPIGPTICSYTMDNQQNCTPGRTSLPPKACVCINKWIQLKEDSDSSTAGSVGRSELFDGAQAKDRNIILSIIKIS